VCQLVFIALALLEVLYYSVQRNGHWVSSIEGSRIRWMAPYDYVRCLRMADHSLEGRERFLGDRDLPRSFLYWLDSEKRSRTNRSCSCHCRPDHPTYVRAHFNRRLNSGSRRKRNRVIASNLSIGQLTSCRRSARHSPARGGSLQAQLLHSFPQVLVIDLEDNPRAIIRSRKDIGSGVLTIYRLA
jgi:hypothetical protein